MTNHSHDVTLIHRRDALRAEKILQDRLFAHPNIKVLWNTRGRPSSSPAASPRGWSRSTCATPQTGEIERLDVEGGFVAIGHSPATELFKGQLELDADGYIQVETGHHPDQRPRRVRLRRRHGQDLPPGGHRRRHRLHGRARRREVPRRGRFRSGAGRSRREAAGRPEPPSRAAAPACTAAEQGRLVAGAGEGVGIAVDRSRGRSIRPLKALASELARGGDAVASPLGEDQPGAAGRSRAAPPPSRGPAASLRAAQKSCEGP